jgi:hypothetical protein
MAYAKIVFEHPVTKEIKEAPVGFSWSTLFLGLFVPIYRGDWKWAIIMLLAGSVTFGISWIVFPFIYNKLYIKDIIKKGYKTKEVLDSDIKIIENKIGFKLPTMT